MSDETSSVSVPSELSDSADEDFRPEFESEEEREQEDVVDSGEKNAC